MTNEKKKVSTPKADTTSKTNENVEVKPLINQGKEPFTGNGEQTKKVASDVSTDIAAKIVAETPVKPKTSKEGFLVWLIEVYKKIDDCIVEVTDMKTYKTSSDHEVTVATTKLKTANSLIAKCIVSNGGVEPTSKVE